VLGTTRGAVLEAEVATPQGLLGLGFKTGMVLGSSEGLVASSADGLVGRLVLAW
jgi:hypothetical protein